ncbi:MAG: 2-oxo acid dehydrogenase subunit E2 [Candidatus Omnitrophica bacterium]|nr:2-oxo acid dehydrogenase subunit E2 [Candidatus Omnitrophota bacterium]
MDIRLPEVGENIKGGTVVKVSVSVGDQVKKDQDLLELETEKASFPVPSPTAGVVKEILVKEGQEVKVGTVVIRLETTDSAPVSAGAQEKQPAATNASAPTTTTSTTSPTEPSPVNHVSLATSAPTTRTSSPTHSTANVPAAPSIRRLARELGINLIQVPGSGPQGRISKDDVKAFAKSILQSGGGAATVAQRSLPDFAKWGNVRREKMNNIRKKTAEHMTYCWSTIPHVTQFDKADITDLEKLRKQHSTPERKLTITPFLMKILAAALKNFPQFNASIDLTTQEIVLKDYIHIGVAVDTPRGLVVPVIRDVEKKSILQIADELNATAERIRAGKITLDELQGGSMTVTNLGGIGGTAFTPIVNWPEVAILGISRGSYEPVYTNNQFIPRLMLPLSLSYDHRVVDGADGARFLKWVCEAIQQPLLMELDG